MALTVESGARPQAGPAARVLAMGIPLAVAAGLTLPLQARINGELGHQLHDPLLAGLFSFGGAALVMAVATLLMPSGLAVDRIGLGPGGKRAITALRVLGVLLTVCAVFWAVSPRISGSPDPVSMVVPLLLMGLAGVLMTFQHAANGRIAAQVRSPMPGTLVNYGVGSAALALIWILKLALTGGLPTLPRDPWLYAGGVLGCINLVLSALLIRRIGVLLTGLSMIAGQLIGALLMDWLLPVAGSVIYPQTLYGTLLTLVAIVVAAMPVQALRLMWRRAFKARRNLAAPTGGK